MLQDQVKQGVPISMMDKYLRSSQLHGKVHGDYEGLLDGLYTTINSFETDESLSMAMNNLERKHSDHVVRLEGGGVVFRLRHYFGNVDYDMSGWADDNRSARIDELVSKSPVLRQTLGSGKGSRSGAASKAGARIGTRTRTTRLQRDSLSQLELIQHLGDDVRVIHCISTHRFDHKKGQNGSNRESTLDWGFLDEQMRCTGAWDAWAVARSGFAVRKSRDDLEKA